MELLLKNSSFCQKLKFLSKLNFWSKSAFGQKIELKKNSNFVQNRARIEILARD